MGDIYRLVPLQFTEDFLPKSGSVTSEKSCELRAMAVWPARAVVPVVFLPGIMGTNLRGKGGGQAAWQPPNGLVDGLGEVRDRIKQSPEERQKQLTPDACEVYSVDESVKLPANYLALDDAEAKRRGWGELHAQSYLDFLAHLEQSLNHPYEGIEYAKPEPNEFWRGVIHAKNRPWQLDEAAFRTMMGKVYFPVFACGYNWLQSNEESAAHVVRRVKEIEARIQKAVDKGYFSYAGKIILVTHSMGGLVGRRAAQLLGGKVLGVIHGVQPVTGAPVVYRRFKAGTEVGGWWDLAGAAAAVVLGWDAADITCVMANACGPLELLPTQDYGREWLHITDGEKTIKLPQSDPYSEIYAKSAQECWWGMVDPDLIDPAGQLTDKPRSTPFGSFRKKVKLAKDFHETIGKFCAANTYAYYGDDPGQTTFHKVVWRTSGDLTGYSADDILAAKRTRFKLTGDTSIELKGKTLHFSLDGKFEAGDGTVPTPSGKAVEGLEGIKQVFRLQGFDHQFSYRNKTARHTVLYAFAQLAQEIQLNPDGTCQPS